MIHRLSQKWISAIAPPNTDEDRLAVCAYGLELAMSTLLSTACLITIGFLAGKPADAAVIVGIFYMLQTVGGGYHADTHLKCLVTMMVALTACLVLVPRLSFSGAFCIHILSSLYLWANPVSLHENKKHLLNDKRRLDRRSRCCTAVVSLVCLILICLTPLRGAAALGAAMAAISRAAGIIKGDRHDPRSSSGSSCP